MALFTISGTLAKECFEFDNKFVGFGSNSKRIKWKSNANKTSKKKPNQMHTSIQKIGYGLPINKHQFGFAFSVVHSDYY